MCSNQKKILKTMSAEETERIINLFKEAIKQERSKEEIFENFKDAGIITKNGNLKSPYKDLYIPSEK
jgi:protein involved in temperature-dependent protein secretion